MVLPKELVPLGGKDTAKGYKNIDEIPREFIDFKDVF